MAQRERVWEEFGTVWCGSIYEDVAYLQVREAVRLQREERRRLRYEEKETWFISWSPTPMSEEVDGSELCRRRCAVGRTVRVERGERTLDPPLTNGHLLNQSSSAFHEETKGVLFHQIIVQAYLPKSSLEIAITVMKQ